MIEAQLKSLQAIEEKKKEVEEGNEADNEAMKAQAFKSYEAYTKTDNKEKVLASDYKSMLKFLIYLSPNEDKSISFYKNKGLIVKKLKDMNSEPLMKAPVRSVAAAEETTATQDDPEVQEVPPPENASQVEYLTEDSEDGN